jgi:hypothetical protein
VFCGKLEKGNGKINQLLKQNNDTKQREREQNEQQAEQYETAE